MDLPKPSISGQERKKGAREVTNVYCLLDICGLILLDSSWRPRLRSRTTAGDVHAEVQLISENTDPEGTENATSFTIRYIYRYYLIS